MIQYAGPWLDGAAAPILFCNMETMYFTLAGADFRLDTHIPLEITAELREFCIPRPGRTDGWIRVSAVPRLPAPAAGGVRFDRRLFEYHPDEERVFHDRGPGTEPDALVRYGTGGQIRLVLRSGFPGPELPSHLLVNLLGLERVLLELDALLLHASFIRFRGRGILFSAPSGTGKSTQAALWAAHRGAEILNGDRAAIRCTDGQWRSYGLPLAGSSRIYRNESAPIEAIVVLGRAPEDRIRPLSPAEALRALLPEFSVHRWDSTFVERVLDISTALVQAVPVYLLECTPEQSAVELLHRTLRKGGL